MARHERVLSVKTPRLFCRETVEEVARGTVERRAMQAARITNARAHMTMPSIEVQEKVVGGGRQAPAPSEI